MAAFCVDFKGLPNGENILIDNCVGKINKVSSEFKCTIATYTCVIYVTWAGGNDGRYDTKSIDTTDTILLKVGINTNNPVPRYRYFDVIFKLIQKWFYTPEQESCLAGLHKDLCQGSKV